MVIVQHCQGNFEPMNNFQAIQDLDKPSYRVKGEEEIDVNAGENQECPPQFVKNRPWAGEEHLLYIIFLEIHRQRAKSKLVRHSNNFFKEMAGLVKSKTEIQCRSHHHKYEEKYKYPYRIIKEERIKLEAEGFSYVSALQKVKSSRGALRMTQQEVKKEQKEIDFKKTESGVSVDCQTSIEGTEVVFMTQEEFNQLCLSQHYGETMHQAHPPMSYYPQVHSLARMAPPPFYLRR